MGQCISSLPQVREPPEEFKRRWGASEVLDGPFRATPAYTTTANVGIGDRFGYNNGRMGLDPIDEHKTVHMGGGPLGGNGANNGANNGNGGNKSPSRTPRWPSEDLGRADSSPREGSRAQGTSEGNSWKKGELIGQGAYGSVFLGLDQETGQLMAVKAVQVPRAASQKIAGQVAALEAEVKLLRRLDHPNIVRYLYTEQSEEALHIFLEYVPGGSIASLVTKFGSLPEPVIRVYTRQILTGLEYLHRHGIIHRDIKGANILVDISGNCKLADFGASKQIEELATLESGFKSVKGTPYWMAPEVIKQSGHGRQADIWSVACTVIEMATGRPPWSELGSQVAAMFQIASSKGPPTIPENLSAECKDFLYLCFNRNWKERPLAAQLLRHPFLATPEPAPRRMAVPPLPGLMEPVAKAPDAAEAADALEPAIKAWRTPPGADERRSRDRAAQAAPVCEAPRDASAVGISIALPEPASPEAPLSSSSEEGPPGLARAGSGAHVQRLDAGDAGPELSDHDSKERDPGRTESEDSGSAQEPRERLLPARSRSVQGPMQVAALGREGPDAGAAAERPGLGRPISASQALPSRAQAKPSPVPPRRSQSARVPVGGGARGAGPAGGEAAAAAGKSAIVTTSQRNLGIERPAASSPQKVGPKVERAARDAVAGTRSAAAPTEPGAAAEAARRSMDRAAAPRASARMRQSMPVLGARAFGRAASPSKLKPVWERAGDEALQTPRGASAGLDDAVGEQTRADAQAASPKRGAEEERSPQDDAEEEASPSKATGRSPSKRDAARRSQSAAGRSSGGARGHEAWVLHCLPPSPMVETGLKPRRSVAGGPDGLPRVDERASACDSDEERPAADEGEGGAPARRSLAMNGGPVSLRHSHAQSTYNPMDEPSWMAPTPSGEGARLAAMLAHADPDPGASFAERRASAGRASAAPPYRPRAAEASLGASWEVEAAVAAAALAHSRAAEGGEVDLLGSWCPPRDHLVWTNDDGDIDALPWDVGRSSLALGPGALLGASADAPASRS